MNAPQNCVDPKITQSFERNYPQLQLTGKANEYYKCQEVLDAIKETAETVYHTTIDFQNLINMLNEKHESLTRKGNGTRKREGGIYKMRETN